MITNEVSNRKSQIANVAQAMMTAARTAPKAKGVDNLEIISVTDDDLQVLADKMREISSQNGFKFFLRDADNVCQAQAVVLIGTRIGTFGLNCGFCGFGSCVAKSEHATIPCAFNMGDLGIAVGSAVSVAADARVDSRVMYSVGDAALKLGWLPECKAAFGILLSCSGKNPFFDRVSNK